MSNINTSNNSQILKEDSSELGLLSPNNEIKSISKENVLEMKQGMPYIEIIKKLGSTKDVGSGLFVAQYIVDEKVSLTISFANINDKCTLNGEQLLEKAKSISQSSKRD
jgi:hypothetical protein